MKLALAALLLLVPLAAAQDLERPARLAAAIEKNADGNPALLYVAGSAYATVGDADEARRVASLLPEDDGNRARVLAEAGDVEEAVRLAQKLPQPDGDDGDYPPEAGDLVDSALLTLLSLGHDDAARAVLAVSADIDLDADFYSLYPYRAALGLPGEPGKAVALWERSLAAQLMFLRGDRERAAREAAAARLVAAVELLANMADASAVEGLAWYYALAGDEAGLDELATTVSELPEPAAYVALQQATLAARRGDRERSQEHVRRAGEQATLAAQDDFVAIGWYAFSLGYAMAHDAEAAELAMERPVAHAVMTLTAWARVPDDQVAQAIEDYLRGMTVGLFEAPLAAAVP